LGKLPCEASLERIPAPRISLGDILGTKLHTQQIDHYGDGYRALDSVWIFGDLRLAQFYSPLAVFIKRSTQYLAEVKRAKGLG
jgi:hypothetical protein